MDPLRLQKLKGAFYASIGSNIALILKKLVEANYLFDKTKKLINFHSPFKGPNFIRYRKESTFGTPNGGVNHGQKT